VYFPGSTGGEAFEIHVPVNTDTCIGYALLQDAGPGELGAHLYIGQEYRTPKYLRALIKYFKQAMHKQLVSRNKTVMVTMCQYEDTATRSLFRAMQLETTDICVGKLILKET